MRFSAILAVYLLWENGANLEWLLGSLRWRRILCRFVRNHIRCRRQQLAVVIFPNAQEDKRQDRGHCPKLCVARKLCLRLPPEKRGRDYKSKNRPHQQRNDLDAQVPNLRVLHQASLQAADQIGGREK